MTASIQPTIRTLGVLLVIAVLAGCAGQLRRPDQGPSTPVQAAEQALARGDYANAATQYLNAVSSARSADRRARLRFEAGLAAAQAGQATRARRLLDAVDEQKLEQVDRARYELARAEIQVADLSPDEALAQLQPPRGTTPPAVAQRLLGKRAELYFRQNDLIRGIHALVQRGRWLDDDTALRYNDQAIYEQAQRAISFGQGPDSRPAENAGATTRGWLALARIGQRRYASRAERDQALAAWERNYPRHPATRSVLEQRFDYTGHTTAAQRRRPGAQNNGRPSRPRSDTVALALPLSGKFANAAAAIRDGFMFAYNRDNTAAGKPLVYDTSSMSADDILNRARRDGVGILDGPLRKDKVSQFSRLDSRIPTIALNAVQTPANRPGFYQFALAPEDSARAVARHADDQDYDRAIALTPEGDWGDRVLAAFAQAFEQRGGRLVDSATYDASARDYRGPIRSVLQSYHSGRGVDFIFVAARPIQARLIRSQLRFYHATNLPMFATSHVYTGTPDPDNDIDLNGVGFSDLPWVVGDSDYIQRRRSAAEQRYGSAATRYKRLFAMGMDAWLLTDHIARRGLQAGDAHEGMTGVLAVQPGGRIQRYLAWAEFEDGQPTLVSMPRISEVRAEQNRARPRSRSGADGYNRAGANAGGARSGAGNNSRGYESRRRNRRGYDTGGYNPGGADSGNRESGGYGR